MKKITLNNGYGTTYIFEVVDKIPSGYSVWNIRGLTVEDEHYTPLCQTIRPEDKNCYEVNTNTLKAIKLSAEEVEVLKDAASYGVETLKKAESALKRVAKTQFMKQKQKRAKKALLILKKITL